MKLFIKSLFELEFFNFCFSKLNESSIKTVDSSHIDWIAIVFAFDNNCPSCFIVILSQIQRQTGMLYGHGHFTLPVKFVELEFCPGKSRAFGRTRENSLFLRLSPRAELGQKFTGNARNLPETFEVACSSRFYFFFFF